MGKYNKNDKNTEGVSAFIFEKAAKKVYFAALLFNDFIVEGFEGFYFTEIADLCILLVVFMDIKKHFFHQNP